MYSHRTVAVIKLSCLIRKPNVIRQRRRAVTWLVGLLIALFKVKVLRLYTAIIILVLDPMRMRSFTTVTTPLVRLNGRHQVQECSPKHDVGGRHRKWVDAKRLQGHKCTSNILLTL